jgi:hypothetical protein
VFPQHSSASASSAAPAYTSSLAMHSCLWACLLLQFVVGYSCSDGMLCCSHYRYQVVPHSGHTWRSTIAHDVRACQDNWKRVEEDSRFRALSRIRGRLAPIEDQVQK